jgi:hypothetical protein
MYLIYPCLAARSHLAKRSYVALRENYAAVTIQKLIRGW